MVETRLAPHAPGGASAADGRCGPGAHALPPTILWALLLVTVIVVIVIVVARSMSAGRARAETLRVLAESVRGLSLACRLDGHVYRKAGTGYQSATCGSQLDRVEGKRYVLNEDRRGGGIAAIVRPDQFPLSESGQRTERPTRAR